METSAQLRVAKELQNLVEKFLPEQTSEALKQRYV
jgi:hypothetical protein